MVQLYHLATARYLAVLPGTSSVLQSIDDRVVTTEGKDLNSCFQLKTAKPSSGIKKIEVFDTDIILMSLNNKCALSMGSEQLPEYAAKQIEVSCTRRHNKTPPAVLFTLEQNISPNTESNNRGIKPAGFFSKLLEMQVSSQP